MEKNKLIMLGLVLFCLNSEAAYVVTGNNEGEGSVAIGNLSNSKGNRSSAKGYEGLTEGLCSLVLAV